MKKVEYDVNNLCCNGCATKIQEKAATMEGILQSNLDLYRKKLILEIDEKFNEENFLKTINLFADAIEPGTTITKKEINFEDNLNLKSVKKEKRKKEERKKEKLEEISLIVGIILFVCIFISEKFSDNLKLTFAILAYTVLGWNVVYKSLKNLSNGNFMDENFLMSVATFGAFYLNEPKEAVGVMLFYKIGEFFQEKAVAKSRKSIEKLLDIRPDYANVKDKMGNIIKVYPQKLKIGDIIVVKSGEKIPVDGVVTKGESSLNMSALTGEALPIDVACGDEVLSGSLNSGGVLEIKVTKLFENSTINKIIELVEHTSTKKPKAEKFITKFAKYYTPFVVISAVIIATVVPFILGNFNLWFGRALIFLVISCPCALVLSVPLTFFSSIGLSSKRGILIKGGNYLEALSDVGTIVFDKTGTLTKGKFKIDKIENVNCSTEEFLESIKIGEFYSNHPIAKTILKYKTGFDIAVYEKEISNYREINGQGISVFYKDVEILVGNYKLMKERNIKTDEKIYPGTVVYVAKDNIFLGNIFISDEIKEDSRNTIEKLNSLNIKTYMLTGDNKIIGEKVGEMLNISPSNIFTNLLPEDKVNKLEKIKNETSKKIVFVGDGINDAPVLSVADIGIAMGGIGSDIAIETADVVIMKDELSKIIELLHIARVNKKVVLENIIFALGIKVLVMILGIFGIANMWLAIFADVGVSIIAVLNAYWGVKRQLNFRKIIKKV